MLNEVSIGNSTLRTPPIGIGAWQWGDTAMWGYGRAYGRADVEAAFYAAIGTGLRLIDTAEVYGAGQSERIVGDLVRQTDQPVIVATKFAPLPTRIGRRTVLRALNDSLSRLGLAQIDLYQVHWPFPIIPIEMLMDILADAVDAGKVRYIGVSNYSEAQMRRAHAALAGRGLPLVSNQVEYSLLHRTPEVNGVWAACQELGVTLIAYSPLAKGLLSGKYKPGSPPPGLRALMRKHNGSALERIQPVIQLLTDIGAAHGGKSPAQVALNWLARQPSVIPIPGAKNAAQAGANAGAIGWDLTTDEADSLSQATLEWRQ